jgi:lipopolysaccharide/colanic/teichoic acid biosynthesis glycosyltransferase
MANMIGSVAAASLPVEIRQRFSFLGRIRYQLVGGLLVAVLLPQALWSQSPWLSPGSSRNTLVGTAVAFLIGAYLLRRLSRYPGVGSTAPIMPTFATAYAVVISVFFFSRVDYSRFVFLASFVFAIAWYFFAIIIERRALRPLLVLVPGGNSQRLIGVGLADWRVASSADDIPYNCTGVVADLRADHSPEWEKFLATCALQGIPVYHWKQISESLTGQVEIEHLSENSFGSLVPSSIYFRCKRLGDVLFAIAVLPLAVPLGGLIALAIGLDSSGPLLFRQRRLGFRGRVFTMLKFRTMHPQAEAGSHFTTENDSRITRVGRFLRRYRLDELPQIVNILKGEMSWIGPRPEALALATWYESEIPFYAYRHIVRPGITGWAQVNQGNVAEIEAATSKLHYDFFYIKHFSFWLDLLIAAKTVRTVLTGFGAL